jgi:predicted phosphodiesterase
VRTLIVSDLHLGSPSRADALRDQQTRALLLDAAREADRIVLLGDLIELRDGDTRDAEGVARLFFEDLSREFTGGEVAIVAGNHDHALVGPWLARRRELAHAPPLALEQRLHPDASPMLASLAQWLAPVPLSLFYPGLWVRDDVYAIHGHYLDCHMRIAGGERLVLAATSGPTRRRRLRSVDDYEAVTSSVYARLDSSEALRRLARSRTLSHLGRLLSGLPNQRLVLAERAAMGEVAGVLGLSDAYVVFGHTHRPGPFAGDDRSRWRGRHGARLVNCGCWLEHGMGADGGPRAPCVVVEDSGPPVATWLDGRLPTAAQSARDARQQLGG